MNIIEKILLFLHLLGMAFLLGGLFTQIKSKQKLLNRGIRDGAYMQVITGPLLLWVQPTMDDSEPINDTLIGIKSLIVLSIFTIILINKKSKNLTNSRYYILLGLAVFAVAIALFLY